MSPEITFRIFKGIPPGRFGKILLIHEPGDFAWFLGVSSALPTIRLTRTLIVWSLHRLVHNPHDKAARRV
jgi:hypothetical protein